VAVAQAMDNWQEFGDSGVNLSYTTEEPALAELSDELIDFLSSAIDSNDVVELTPEILAELLPADEPAPLPLEEPARVILAPDPERAFAAQDASIEEFLSSLEAAISADKADLEQQVPDLESKNGQTAITSPTQSEAKAVADFAATEVDDSQPDPVQPDRAIPIVSLEPEKPHEPLQEQPVGEPKTGQSRQQSNMLTWLIVFLVIVAAALLFAILVVLVIGSDLIQSIAA
jgi:hypothetical protein